MTKGMLLGENNEWLTPLYSIQLFSNKIKLCFKIFWKRVIILQVGN